MADDIPPPPYGNNDTIYSTLRKMAPPAIDEITLMELPELTDLSALLQ
jgi:hypothetical protein